MMTTTTTNEAEPRAKRSKNHTHSSLGTILGSSNDENAASTAEKQGEDDLQAKIVAAWNNQKNEEDQLNNHPDAAFAATVTILSTQVDKLIQEGIAAFHEAESNGSELAHVQQEMTRKDAEIASLRAAEEKNTVALSVRTIDSLLVIPFVAEGHLI